MTSAARINRLVICVAFVAATGVPLQGNAFHILSPRTEACHEKLTLAALGLGEFSVLSNPIPALSNPSPASNILGDFSKSVIGAVPADAATRGLMREVRRRYSLHDLSDEELFVVASFLVGVREPDTNGFSAVDLNELRSIHARDDQQSAHALRRMSHDGSEGKIAAIREARSRLEAIAADIIQKFRESPAVIASARWTFPFYGEKQVLVHSASFQLGLVSHIVQDSYSHFIRDDEMNVLDVSNFVELISESLLEVRDGPAHSDRLDQCNPSDEFDRRRIRAAVDATGSVIEAIRSAGRASQGSSKLEANQDQFSVLNRIFAVREGCDVNNSYCDSEWYKKAAEDFTAPLNLSSCAAVSRDHGEDRKRSISAKMAFFFALGLFAFAWIILRQSSSSRRPVGKRSYRRQKMGEHGHRSSV